MDDICPPSPYLRLVVSIVGLYSRLFGYMFGYFAAFDFEDGLNFMEKSKTPSFAAGYT
jgi:hypothetical protein